MTAAPAAPEDYGIVSGYDPDTMHEMIGDFEALRTRTEQLRSELADEPDPPAELMLRGELVDRLRVGRQLDDVLAEADAALERSRAIGTAAQQHLACLRKAHVHQWRAEFGTSNAIFAQLVGHGNEFGPVVQAFTYQHAGKNLFDQGRFAEAADEFARALALREEFELPDDQLDSLATARAKAADQ
ncbi:MAG: hypothetical protein ACR2KJ_10840 [Jatrophihabitans sp.]